MARAGFARGVARLLAVLLLAGGLQLWTEPAEAGGWGGGGGWHGGGWHGGGWWGGGWRGCCWGGGWGWWGPSISLGFAAPLYYPYAYPYPSYPYPYPYAYANPYPAYAPPSVQQAPPGPAPQQTWYYCANPQGYYPYVQSCSSGWQQVPVAPPTTH
jgi:hypothetical protein